ncbi:hypothetical protein GCM10010308_75940 [Streptomyces vinaceusdrappus]|nr:hypothetical protein GCM10010308_75940 [Streptomyces vinaceusdrappus]
MALREQIDRGWVDEHGAVIGEGFKPPSGRSRLCRAETSGVPPSDAKGLGVRWLGTQVRMVRRGGHWRRLAGDV